MPFYEFECACGEVTEELTKLGTESITCPKCGDTARKILSRCTFSLKGGGWYADGYASAKSPSASSSAPAKTESKSTTTSSSSDSK